MKHSLVALIFFLVFATPTLAYDLFLSEPDKPYAVVPIDGDIEHNQTHLGSLENYTIMYEVDVSKSSTLTVGLSQLVQGSTEPISFGLMVVKLDAQGGGVTEVVRFNPSKEDWMVTKDKSVGLTFGNSEVITKELEEGIYRIEVSTPNNQGKYVLRLGDDVEGSGYFENLSRAYNIQKFFGYSVLRMLTVPTVYYPLGALLLMFLVFKVRKYKKNI